MQWRRKIGWVLALAAVIFAVGYGFIPRPVLVDSATVTRGPLRVTVREEGKTRVVDRYVVSAPVAGALRRIDLDVGDTIRRGQPITYIDPPRASVLDPRSRAEAMARVDAAKASVQSAEESVEAASADARLAESNLARIRQLYDAGTIAREELERAEAEERRTKANLLKARSSVEVARHELEVAQAALRYSPAEPGSAPAESVPVVSPVAGRILKLYRESEGIVSVAEPLVEISNPRSLEVEVEVLSSDAVRISPGTRVLFERWGGDQPLEGAVRRIEPVGFTKISALGVEEQRVLVIADFTSPAETWERLGDNYRVEAVFILWESDNVLQVPASALFRHEQDWAVFVAANGHAGLRPVQIGHRSGLNAEITSGLQEGERVITHPGNEIEHGTAIELRTQ
jgi:HlyD family secretion protein